MLCFNIWYRWGLSMKWMKKQRMKFKPRKKDIIKFKKDMNEIKDTASPEELEALSDEGVDILNEIEELRGDKC
jgi:hypothetical protein